MKNSFKKTKIDTANYINKETGESLQSENLNITSFNEINDDFVIIDYKNYIIIDYKAISYIEKEFTSSEKGRIFQIIQMIKGYNNFLHKANNEYHDRESLMKEIEYSRNKFSLFLNKLVKKGVLYELKGSWNRRVSKRFILNLYIARASKTTNKEIISYFDDVRV